MDTPATDSELAPLIERLDRLISLFEEFVPALRAYFDPAQSGPRGWAIRKALTKAEANGHG